MKGIHVRRSNFPYECEVPPGKGGEKGGLTRGGGRVIF